MQPLEEPIAESHVFSLHQAGMEYLPLCCDALINSEYGQSYFGAADNVESFLRQGFERNEVTYAANKEGFFVGFIWYTLESSFRGFPFIQAMAVKPSFRSIGAGTYLISHFEKVAFATANTVFVLVSSANPGVLRLFKRLQYRPIGRIPHLIIPGTDEVLLSKYRLS
jgi:ribosomal protein S18 acetylase RimI-like enzyme